ncbi:protein MAIN-LIKE 2-like [Mercurialis annua]|uniref:protein MAIN-LIKE 2-like n=1 Tax=Mercurialis annua TaxID=3986 RepID=UPI0024ADC1BE|nr:protein MAIN-LIKE 2-like [Mercurialis annua]
MHFVLSFLFFMQNKIRARFKFVEDWQLDAKVTKAIQHLSFFQISTISGCKFNPRLVAAFCNLYHESDDVFEIGQHKLGISLEDVFMFTGLPVDGMPLVIAESLEPLEVCKHLLGWDRVGIDAVKPGSINLKRLQEKFMVVPTEVEDHSQELKYYVRAYLLALIGSILLPRSTEQIVPVSYLLFIDDIDRVDDYAWGAGLLAQLNSGIRKFRNEPRKCAYGAFWLIQMFIMEHFPSLAKKIMLDHSNTLPTRLPKRIPLVVEWSKLLKGPSMQSLKNTNFAEMLAAPNLEFISRPYERIEGIVRSRLFYSRTLLIGLNYLAYHRPDLFPDQLGIGEVDMSDLRKIIRFKEKIRTGDSGKNWPRNYKQYINEWKFRYQSCVKDCSEGTDFVLPQINTTECC